MFTYFFKVANRVFTVFDPILWSNNSLGLHLWQEKLYLAKLQIWIFSNLNLETIWLVFDILHFLVSLKNLVFAYGKSLLFLCFLDESYHPHKSSAKDMFQVWSFSLEVFTLKETVLRQTMPKVDRFWVVLMNSCLWLMFSVLQIRVYHRIYIVIFVLFSTKFQPKFQPKLMCNKVKQLFQVLWVVFLHFVFINFHKFCDQFCANFDIVFSSFLMRFFAFAFLWFLVVFGILWILHFVTGPKCEK